MNLKPKAYGLKSRARNRVFVRLSPAHFWDGRGASLFFLIVAGFLLLFSLARPGAMGGLRMNAADLFAPILSTVSEPFYTAAAFVGNVSGVAQMQAENASLRAENARLRQWYQAALTLQNENVRLQNLLNLKTEKNHSYITTRVIADAGNAYVKSVLIAAGQQENVQKGQAVLADEGMVGRIIETGQKASRVLLLTDLNSRVPIVVEDTDLKAILSGTNEPMPVLKHVPADHQLKDGMRVLTSGHGGFFVPGLPIGRLKLAENGTISVQLLSDIHRLSYVRVLDAPLDPNLHRGVL